MKKICLLFFVFCLCSVKAQITLETLLDEMVSVEATALFPNYQTLQQSSYDRRSVSSSNPVGWFANDDGFGYNRTENNSGRTEKVLFEANGAGAITRIWLTTQQRNGVLRFYFDGNTTPDWTIPAYDMLQFGISLGLGLCQPHINNDNNTTGKGGSTFYLPLPYSNGCKITLEDPANSIPRYYHVNYRACSAGTTVETFSAAVAARAAAKIAEVNTKLLNPQNFTGGIEINTGQTLAPNDSVFIDLPAGTKIVKTLEIEVTNYLPENYARLMRDLILTAEFDDKQTVFAPLGDFSGGGMGAPAIESYFLSANGTGKIICRYPMPYQHAGKISVKNYSDKNVYISIKVNTDNYIWQQNSLYFHASWRQERGIRLTKYDQPANCLDWNFATLTGRGIYKGDVLTLFNYSPRWYGEGDEKIYIDNETFPSHFGTGTEDYYNCSWAPVRPFHTPFGGAPRAELESSAGYNTFFRTRNLDGIPFSQKLKFDIEMMSWENGTADYATTAFWYGDLTSAATSASGIEEALQPLPASTYDYKIPHSIEFENITPTEKSPALNLETQDMNPFATYRWSEAKQLLIKNVQIGEYLIYEFSGFENRQYRVQIQGTKAVDFGILTFKVNNGTPKNIDFFNNGVIHTGVIELGNYTPDTDGKFTLTITYKGKNTQATGNLVGLDCIQFIEEPFSVPNAIELENQTHSAIRGNAQLLSQNMTAYKNGKWSNDYQKVYQKLTDGDWVDFQFSMLGTDTYKITVFPTMGPDFAIIQFAVNDNLLAKKYDCYHNLVCDMGAVELGTFAPKSDGTITLHIKIVGTNPMAANPKYIMGIDCVLLEKQENAATQNIKKKDVFYQIENNRLAIKNFDTINSLIITDLLGKKMLETTKNFIDISPLIKGYYIVSVNGKWNEKIYIDKR